MKKITLLMLIAIMTIGISAEAQVLSTKSRKITITKEHKERKPIPWKWYAKGGIALMNAGFKEPGGIGRSDFVNVGYNLVGGFQWGINRTDWYWGAQAGFSMIGGYASRGYTILLGPQIGRRIQTGIGSLDLHLVANFEKVIAEGEEQIDKNISTDDLLISPEVGIGLWFNRILVELSYRHGFCLDYHCLRYSNNLMLSVGYQF